MNKACYDTYFTARSSLLKQAQDKGLRHHEVLHPAKGPEGQNLYMDFLYAGPREAQQVLLHVSGIHGVEGFAGSLVQEAIYQKFDFSKTSCGVCFVVCANPYGMSWIRRTNDQNVDLNRSYFSGSDRNQLMNTDYRYFSKLMAPSSVKEQWQGILQSLYWFFKIGKNNTVQAISGGQREFPEGLFYSGLENPFEILKIRGVLKDLFHHISRLYVIDVHTGLGPYLGETLYGDAEITPEQLDFFARVIQTPVVQSSKSEGSYENKGYWSRALRDGTSWDVYYFLQEFGTKSLFLMIKSLQRENFEHFHNPGSFQKKKNLKEVFFIDSDDWKRNLITLGTLRFQQIYESLSVKIT